MLRAYFSLSQWFNVRPNDVLESYPPPRWTGSGWTCPTSSWACWAWCRTATGSSSGLTKVRLHSPSTYIPPGSFKNDSSSFPAIHNIVFTNHAPYFGFIPPPQFEYVYIFASNFHYNLSFFYLHAKSGFRNQTKDSLFGRFWRRRRGWINFCMPAFNLHTHKKNKKNRIHDFLSLWRVK